MGRLGLLVVGVCMALAIPALAVSKKRAAPAAVAPVVLDGVRYKPQHWGTVAGEWQNGGFVSAVDGTTGRELWVAKIYDTRRDATIEGDKQDVYITHLEPVAGGRALMIQNERGARFLLDLTTHRSNPE